MKARYAIAIPAAALITLGLFYVMHTLIVVAKPRLSEPPSGKIIDFVRVKRDSELETGKRVLPQKVKPEEPPPPPDLKMADRPRPGKPSADMGVPTAELSVDLAGGPDLEGAVSSAEAVPLVRSAPLYPERARARGIEGWVIVGFTISTTGGVKDPFVIDSEPPGIFDRAALKAVRKFKYRPKVVDGVPVEQPGQKISFDFTLEEETGGRNR